VILSGGELTVTIQGRGRGGPSREYALALAREFDGIGGLAAVLGDTDGTDGGTGLPDDPAGPLSAAERGPRARLSASIPPSFLRTTILLAFSPGWATCSGQVPPIPTSMISVPSSLTDLESSIEIPASAADLKFLQRSRQAHLGLQIEKRH
jgi:hydroxypyruvate reductase